MSHHGLLVQQCRTLEQHIGTGYLQLCLENPTDACSIVCDALKLGIHPIKRLDFALNRPSLDPGPTPHSLQNTPLSTDNTIVKWLTLM